MKKLFAFAVGLTLLMGIAPSALATDTMPSPNFFEALDNQMKLSGFNETDSISGEFSVDTGNKEMLNGKYQLVSKAIEKTGGSYDNSDGSVKINGAVSLKYSGKNADKPFDSLKATFEASLVTVHHDGLYLRLDDYGFDAKGVPAKDLEEYKLSKQKAADALDPLKGQWIFIAQSKLTQGLQGSDSSIADRERFLQSLKTDGVKMAVENLIKEQMSASDSMSSGDIDAMTKGIDRLFNADFFTTNPITSGKNEGFIAFNLNKRGIVQSLEQLGAEFGNVMSADEKTTLEDGLSKFNLSGLYTVNEKYGIYDHMMMQLRLSGIDTLKSFTMNYKMDMSAINKGQVITAPSDFTAIENSALKDLLPANAEPSGGEWNTPDTIAPEAPVTPAPAPETIPAPKATTDVNAAIVAAVRNGAQVQKHGDVYQLGDAISFKFVLQPNAFVSVSQPSWAGVKVSQDGGQSWANWFEVKNGSKYNPVGIFAGAGRVTVDIANDNGTNKGEGDLLRFSSTDGGKTWTKDVCMYLVPEIYSGSGINYQNDLLPFPLNHISNTCEY